MLDKILNGKASTIASAAVIIGTASLASRILGMVRDRVIASTFGAGDNLDAYYAAFKIPDTVYMLVVLGALSAGFIPLMSDMLSESREKAWKFANNVLNILMISLLVVGGILFIFAPWATKLIAPGFEGEKLQLTINLTRILFLSPLLLGISSLFGGVLQSFKRFVAVSVAPVFYNIGIIFSALYFTDEFGIYALAYGVIFGTILHVMIQFYSSVSLGYKYRAVLDFKDGAIKDGWRMMLPRMFSLGVTAVTALILTAFASTLESGSLTLYNFAFNIQSLPFGIFGISFAIAAFPSLCEYASVKNNDGFIQTLTNTTRQILFFMIPLTVLMIALRAQVVRVVLGGGAFDWEATIITANVLAVFSISLFAQSLHQLFSRAFFAIKDSKTPFYTSLVGATLTIGLAWYFVQSPTQLPFHINEISGLAWAYSVGMIFQAFALWFLLSKRIGNLSELTIIKSASKVLLASLAMALVVQFMKYGVEPYFGTDTFFGIFMQGLLSGGVGIGVFMALGMFLNIEELTTLMTSIKKKIFKEKPGLGVEEGIESSVEEF